MHSIGNKPFGKQTETTKKNKRRREQYATRSFYAYHRKTLFYVVKLRISHFFFLLKSMILKAYCFGKTLFYAVKLRISRSICLLKFSRIRLVKTKYFKSILLVVFAASLAFKILLLDNGNKVSYVFFGSAKHSPI